MSDLITLTIDGKTVKITVDKFIPDGTLGYTIWSGEHLNFISSTNPEVKEGDEIMVKVIEIDKQGRVNLSRKDCLK